MNVGDLISRSELVAAINRQYCTGCDNYNGSRCRACHADDMLSLADEAADAQRWISVEERLPERGTWVLCCGAKGGLFLSDWLMPFNNGTVYCSVPNARSGRYAKYWMPLPEPPKEE